MLYSPSDLICPSSRFLEGIEESPYVHSLCKAASRFVEDYCGRAFLGTFDGELLPRFEVYDVDWLGQIFLRSRPLIALLGIGTEKKRVFTATYPDDRFSRVVFGDNRIFKITSDGITNAQKDNYANLDALKIELQGEGWTVDLDDDFANKSLSFLVEQSDGLIWDGWTTDFVVDEQLAIVSGLAPNSTVLVISHFGFEQVPADLEMVLASLIRQRLENPSGDKLQQESLGEYSYTLADVAKLEIGDRRILHKYREVWR